MVFVLSPIMGPIFTFTTYKISDNKEVLKKLDSIIKLLHNMPTQEEFDATFEKLGTSLENLADDITRLTDQLQNGGLTPAQQTAVFDKLNAVADRIKTLADITPEPPVEPAP